MTQYTLVAAEDAEGMVISVTRETGLDADEWAAQTIDQLRAKLEAELPASAYLTLGPYWWPIKRLMIKRGAELTDPTEDQINEVTLGCEYLDIAAGLITHFSQQGAASFSGVFTVTTEHGDVVEYPLSDPEWEIYRSNMTASQS